MAVPQPMAPGCLRLPHGCGWLAGWRRCERASAYLMSLGSCFQDVAQLRGGWGGWLPVLEVARAGWLPGSRDSRGGAPAMPLAPHSRPRSVAPPWHLVLQVVSSGTWRPTQAAASSVAPTLCLTSEGAWREAAAQVGGWMGGLGGEGVPGKRDRGRGVGRRGRGGCMCLYNNRLLDAHVCGTRCVCDCFRWPCSCGRMRGLWCPVGRLLPPPPLRHLPHAGAGV